MYQKTLTAFFFITAFVIFDVSNAYGIVLPFESLYLYDNGHRIKDNYILCGHYNDSIEICKDGRCIFNNLSNPLTLYKPKTTLIPDLQEWHAIWNFAHKNCNGGFHNDEEFKQAKEKYDIYLQGNLPVDTTLQKFLHSSEDVYPTGECDENVSKRYYEYINYLVANAESSVSINLPPAFKGSMGEDRVFKVEIKTGLLERIDNHFEKLWKITSVLIVLLIIVSGVIFYMKKGAIKYGRIKRKVEK